MNCTRPYHLRNNRITLRPGLTLLELLVVMAIIATLMAILAATLNKVREAARGFQCKNKLQTVVQNFTLFADDYGHPDRGRESGALPGNRWRLEDFQDSIYGTEEFADQSPPLGPPVYFDPHKQPLICPTGPQRLGRQGMLDLSQGGITPIRNVSMAFNMRLWKASVKRGPRWVLVDVTLSPGVLNNPWAPLVFDVDADAAFSAGPRPPFYSAPPAGDTEGRYANDAFWFPSLRHTDGMHAGFIGGHVWASRTPTEQAGWDWRFQPPPDE